MMIFAFRHFDTPRRRELFIGDGTIIAPTRAIDEGAINADMATPFRWPRHRRTLSAAVRRHSFCVPCRRMLLVPLLLSTAALHAITRAYYTAYGRFSSRSPVTAQPLHAGSEKFIYFLYRQNTLGIAAGTRHLKWSATCRAYFCLFLLSSAYFAAICLSLPSVSF